MNLFNQILVPTDFDDPARHALDLAIEMARAFNASVTLLHVYEVPTYSYYTRAWPLEFGTALEKSARGRLDEAVADAQKQLSSVQAVLRQGSAWPEILAEIPKLGADLLVIGTHGRKGIGRALLGSVAEKLVRLSPVPVLTVHVREVRAPH